MAQPRNLASMPVEILLPICQHLESCDLWSLRKSSRRLFDFEGVDLLFLEKRVAEEDEDDDAPFSMLAAAACDNLNAFTSLLQVSINRLDMQRLRDRWIREDLMGISPMEILLNFCEEPGHDNAFYMLTHLASAGIRDGPWKLHFIYPLNRQLYDAQRLSFRSVRKLAQRGAFNTLMFMLQVNGPVPRKKRCHVNPYIYEAMLGAIETHQFHIVRSLISHGFWQMWPDMWPVLDGAIPRDDIAIFRFLFQSAPNSQSPQFIADYRHYMSCCIHKAILAGSTAIIDYLFSLEDGLKARVKVNTIFTAISQDRLNFAPGWQIFSTWHFAPEWRFVYGSKRETPNMHVGRPYELLQKVFKHWNSDLSIIYPEEGSIKTLPDIPPMAVLEYLFPEFDFNFSMTRKEELAIRMVEKEYLESQKSSDEDGKMTCDLWKRPLANILYDAALKFGQLRVLEAIFDRCPTWAREYDAALTHQSSENSSFGVVLTHLGRHPDTDTTLEIIRLLHNKGARSIFVDESSSLSGLNAGTMTPLHMFAKCKHSLTEEQIYKIVSCLIFECGVDPTVVAQTETALGTALTSKNYTIFCCLFGMGLRPGAWDTLSINAALKSSSGLLFKDMDPIISTFLNQGERRFIKACAHHVVFMLLPVERNDISVLKLAGSMMLGCSEVTMEDVDGDVSLESRSDRTSKALGYLRRLIFEFGVNMRHRIGNNSPFGVFKRAAQGTPWEMNWGDLRNAIVGKTPSEQRQVIREWSARYPGPNRPWYDMTVDYHLGFEPTRAGRRKRQRRRRFLSTGDDWEPWEANILDRRYEWLGVYGRPPPPQALVEWVLDRNHPILYVP